MDNTKNKPTFDSEKKIYFSQAVKAGKRIYYLDVKKNKRDELFLSITESKKVFVGENEEGQFNFEKHKIFLYKEDFGKFIDALSNAIRFIHENDDVDDLSSLEEREDAGVATPYNQDEEAYPTDEEIDLKIDF